MACVEFNTRVHCCECGGHFTITDSDTVLFGMERIRCPHCYRLLHRVKSCRR